MNRPARRRSACGFTLLECLVALAILAVALTASFRALGASTRAVETLREHTLASWVAYNRLAELRATGTFPAPGVQRGEARQAGQVFIWQETISTTPNSMFRRVDVEVRDASERPLASATGFAVRPLR